MTELKSKNSLRLKEIADRVGAQLEGNGETLISAVAPIDQAGPGELSFVANKAYVKYIATTLAAALVLDRQTPCDRVPVLRHENPYLITALIIDLLYPEAELVPPGRHPSAVIEPGAVVDETTGIGPFCFVRAGARIGRHCQLSSSVYIGANVTLGDNCKLYPGVRIMNDCRIGNNVIFHSGVVIGSDGFGFAESPTGLKKIRQVGWVEIADDVEIGANTTVDRGAIGPTRIGKGTKIDNLVQIAHNVQVGEHCILVAQVGVSGSSKLGNGVVLAGQVGITGHIELGDGVQVGAQSGVPKSIPAGKSVFGYPARDFAETMRIWAAEGRLPDLLKRVHALERKVGGESGD